MRRKADVSWRDTDKRMRMAVKLRQQGLSLRKIADRLVVDKRTIQRDLARWEAAEVDRFLGHFTGAYVALEPRMPHSYAPDEESE